MSTTKAEIGMIGLGVMGRNLLLNMADHGFAVAGYDMAADKVAALEQEGAGTQVFACGELTGFLDRLQQPRAVMLLVPAGDPVDAVIKELVPHLATGDLIIDGGNSYFADTDRRTQELEQKGLLFLGVGVSGGESGARHGPSMMPGGIEVAYRRVQPIFEAAAARVGEEPCVTWLGPASAGHYVKMIHNGIEYGLMQLIAESYDLLKRGLGFSNRRLHETYRRWNEGELNSYLMEITAAIFLKQDERSDQDLVDVILDAARQKGTGMWTSQQGLERQVPVPNIDFAVMMRDLSAFKKERQQAAEVLGGSPPSRRNEPGELVDCLQRALAAAFVITFAQGMALLQRASTDNGYQLDLAEVARIWRGGCIIRAALLEDLRTAYRRQPQLANLLLDHDLGQRVLSRQDDLRKVVCLAAQQGIPAPGLMAALSYFDAYRSARLPANLIQAQRDFFGAHTYQRIDAEGTFHTKWEGSCIAYATQQTIRTGRSRHLWRRRRSHLAQAGPRPA